MATSRTGVASSAKFGFNPQIIVRIRASCIEAALPTKALAVKNAVSTNVGFVFVVLVVLLLVGLPVAVWLDLRSLADSNLRRQASDLNSIITSVRGYYASNVVGRILAAPPGTTTRVVNNYEDIPGAIPIPATLSLELGRVISQQQLTSATGLSPITRSPTGLPTPLIISRPTLCAGCGKIRTR